MEREYFKITFFWHRQLHEWRDIHCARLLGQVGMMGLRGIKFYVY